MNLFVALLFGHIVGDFFLQPAILAVKKGASNWIACLHVAIYTLAICVFTTFYWKWALFVFVTHFVVDRFSLADRWLQLIRGRDLPRFIQHGHLNIPPELTVDERENYRILRGVFSGIVYTVIDNSIHLISMFYAYSYFNK